MYARYFQTGFDAESISRQSVHILLTFRTWQLDIHLENFN